MQNIQLLLTGGTIDSEWSPVEDTAVPFARSNIKPYLEKFINPDFEIWEKTITMADSRSIDDNVRRMLLGGISQSKSDRIIITHGTYTMSETAVFLGDAVAKDKKLENKRVILVGSFYPLSGFAQTDAPYNLGYAIGAIEHISPGVYVAMNSRLFKPSEVEKDLVKGKFKIRN